MSHWLSTKPVPDFFRHPIDWLVYRLTVATEFGTIEWWYWDNLVFIGVTLTLLIGVGVLVFAGKRHKRT